MKTQLVKLSVKVLYSTALRSAAVVLMDRWNQRIHVADYDGADAKKLAYEHARTLRLALKRVRVVPERMKLMRKP